MLVLLKGWTVSNRLNKMSPESTKEFVTIKTQGYFEWSMAANIKRLYEQQNIIQLQQYRGEVE